MRSFTSCTGLFVSALLISLSATGPTLASDREAYQNALAAFQQGDYESAARKFEELVEQSPSWASGHVTLGQCYYLLGQPERAESSIFRAQEFDPQTDLFQAYFGAGHLLYSRSSFEQAVRPLEKALEHAPLAKQKSTSLRLAYSYLVSGRHDSARRALERHQHDHGVDSKSAYYLALACHRLVDHTCALENLRLARDTAGGGENNEKLLQYLGTWSHAWALHPVNEDRREELVGQAVKDTRSWYKARPANPVALRYYAETLLAAHRGTDLVRELTPVVQKDRQNCTARVLLAKAFNSLGDGREAEKWAVEAAHCDPSMAEAHVELGVACIHQLRPEHSSLEEVRQDQGVTRKALTSLYRARDLEAAADARAQTLIADALRTLERLDEVEADFVAHDKTYRDDVMIARRDEFRQRCRRILWIVDHDAGVLLPEDEAFYRQHDCRQYARQESRDSN